MLPEPQTWRMALGDCIEHLETMPAACADFSVFSPPFPALYAYTSEAGDIGNSEDLRGEAKLHLSFFFKQLIRVIKPGRIVAVHCMQIPRLKRTGEDGLFDFRGMLIRLGQRAGFVYCYDWLICKNPQVEAIRTHSHALQFASLKRDRTMLHGQLGDFILKFRAPGENAVPVVGDEQVSSDDWIEWAESAWPWYRKDTGKGIRQTDTLNTKAAKGEGDTKHICPLQLGVINRLIRLYTNPGELVLSPFAGIGSEGYEAIKLGRRFYGIELKPEYHAAACKNLEEITEQCSKPKTAASA
jgi:DNA modification methylase